MSGDPDVIERVTSHVERRVGKIETVYHEIISDRLHIDVHHVRSSWRRRYELLVTSGMSELPMGVPDESESPFAEIAILLPRGWPISQEAFDNESNYWPVRLAMELARFPHENKAFISFGHTVANNPLEPFDTSVGFCATILLPPISLPRKFFELNISDRPPTRFWAAVPIYESELALAVAEGSSSLLDRFDEAGVSDVIDPNRKPVG